MSLPVDPAALLDAAHVVSIPMRVRFRGLSVREAMLIQGPMGWAEFAPFLEYDDAEATRWLEAALEAAYVGWPDPVREQVPINATVPAIAPDAVHDVLARFDGCTTAKVKVAERGQAVDDDVARVAEVRAQLGPGAKIRVDANGGWDRATAVEALTRLARYDIEYAEQPCLPVEELAAVRIALARSGTDVPIAADESIRKAEDPMRVAELDAADLIIVKAAPLGGVASALRIVEGAGLPAVVSSALDTSVGIAAGVALAAALQTLDHACGLGTVGLLTDDVTSASLVPHGGQIDVSDSRQVQPDEERLQRLAAPDDRQQWWRDRLRRCLDRSTMLGGDR